MAPRSIPQLSGLSRSKWIEVDLDAIEANLANIRRILGQGVSIFACLKRNAMGCGTLPVARRLEKAGVDGLALGNAAEAAAIRGAGINLPILLYPGVIPSDAAELGRLNLMPTISTVEEVEQWSQDRSTILNVFMKIDAGGLRAGALPANAVGLAAAISSRQNLKLAGVYGHPMSGYGATDEVAFTKVQISYFLKVLQELDAAGLLPPLKMLASSSILLNYPEADLNAVDPGRLLVGIGFNAVGERNCRWHPAVVGLKTSLVMKKSLKGAEALHLQRLIPVREGMILGLIPFGYGDGYPRAVPHGASALIRGKSVRILGPVHSELLRVDLTDVPEAELGDEVVLMGRSGDLEISLEKLAVEWSMSVTDLLSGLRDHVPRVYI